MECEHKFFDLNGLKTCKECGLVHSVILDTSNMTYAQRSQVSTNTKNYLRKDRFYRLFHNLRGLQEIPIPVMEKIPPDISLPNLKKFLKKNKELRKYANKLPSIWYQLGHKMKIITEQETIRACRLFCEIGGKKSFLVLLPHICKKINRPDLLQFLKKPSKTMMNKYNMFI